MSLRCALVRSAFLLSLTAAALAACSGGGSSPAPGNGSPISSATATATPKVTSATPTATPAGASSSSPAGSPAPTATPIAGIATPASYGTTAPGVSGALATEVPRRSDTVADSVGLNVDVLDSMPSSEISTLASRIGSLAVRHLRGGIINSDATYDADVVQMLSAANAKFDGLTDCAGIEYDSTSPTSPAQIQAFDTAIGGALEDVEGPDEVDIRGDANWSADTRACLPSLKTAEPNLPFIAPSLADAVDDAPKLGNIASDVTVGNIHRYFSGFNPGSSGWGGQFPCGTYGALSWAVCEGQINSGTSNYLMITETGYNSVSEVDELTQAKYLSRAILYNLEYGIPRTYLYTLLDVADTNGFGADGLIHTDYSTKPAFTAIQNEIGYFSDRGSPTVETALSVSVKAAAGSMNHLTFRRHDGTYVIAIWNETSSWNVNSKREVVVAPQQVTVSLAQSSFEISAVALNDAGQFVPKAVTTSSAGIALPVDDHVTLLSFKTN